MIWTQTREQSVSPNPYTHQSPYQHRCYILTTEPLGTGLPNWPLYGKQANSIVFNGYGSWVESDNYRSEAVQFIIDNVLPYGAM